ncbi:LacI family DNA-binding transcriptional regulator [Promicromonospora sp. NPDC023805]|uniref:LacI family DNA-binding transcriptional regulator n=1 Tax=Promicromonospora sp. NPDC023805 TaxID=3154696 RepID=UPI0033D28CA7
MPVPRAKINPSMSDVARHAGVSIATVSNVINRPEKVAAATAERVRASIGELGFVRNDVARSLATGSASTVGMVLADLDNSLFVDMAHGAQQGSDASGLRLLLGNAACDLRRQDDYLDLFDEARVRGVLLAPMEDSRSGIERIRAHGRLIVVLNFQQPDVDCCTVLVDNEQVGYLAARHLIEGGRSRLAFLAGREYYQPVQARRAGVRRAVQSAPGVTLEEIDAGGLEFPNGLSVARDLSARRLGDLPDGVVAVADELGNGLIEGLRLETEARVPQDISVVGCEDNRTAQGGPVALTTVQLSGVEMGQAAAELLIEEMTADPGVHRHRTVVLHPSLIARDSTFGASSTELLRAKGA